MTKECGVVRFVCIVQFKIKIKVIGGQSDDYLFVYEPKIICPYVIRALRPLELGFEVPY